uniref:Zinc finger MYND-type containing 15 n=1 Tax=Accipiter nisus TaxID=211598 RepID=A0A8B9N1K9_9AVES
MEFLTGYRAELLELVSLVLGWRWGARGTPPKPGALRRLPPEPGPWVLHTLPNARLGVALPAGGAWRGGGPSGDPRGPLCGDTALTLPDLCRTLTFISLEEEEGGGGGRPGNTPKLVPELGWEPPNPHPRGAPQELRPLLTHPRDPEAPPDPRPPSPGQVLVVTWVLLLTDAHGAPLGFDFELGSPHAPPAHPPARRALALLCRAMGCPMAGGPPRRPRQLDVGDAGLHTALQPAAARLGVTLVGTHLRGWGPPPTLGTPALRSRLCHVCRGVLTSPPSPQCRAVLYCSEGCRAAEALGVHRGWCRQLGGFMGRTAALAQLPFTFTAEVTSETFDKERFLGAQGLSRGGWAHLSMLVRAPDYGVGLGGDCHPLGTPHGERLQGEEADRGVSLPPAPSELPPPNSFFSSWQQYYAWRGLPLSSPLAALLSYPLSLYYIVTSLVPQHCKWALGGLDWEHWGELSVLLPHVSLELLFLGGSVPPPMDGRRFLLHHMVKGGAGVMGAGGGGSPLIPPQGPRYPSSTPGPPGGGGPRWGTGQSQTWGVSPPQAQRVPAYFAEGGEYGCAVARAAVGAATGGGTGPPLLNPFRCPFRQPGLDNALPWYANAFIFQLLYKGGAGGARPPPAAAAPPHSPPASPPRERRRDKRPPRRRR